MHTLYKLAIGETHKHIMNSVPCAVSWV